MPCARHCRGCMLCCGQCVCWAGRRLNIVHHYWAASCTHKCVHRQMCASCTARIVTTCLLSLQPLADSWCTRCCLPIGWASPIPISTCVPAPPALAQVNGFYIEMGAMNGVDLSNTRWLYQAAGWKGLLIEACPGEATHLCCLRNAPLTRLACWPACSTCTM